jgi:hypothetical protein
MSTVEFLSAKCPLYDTWRYDGAGRAPTGLFQL